MNETILRGFCQCARPVVLEKADDGSFFWMHYRLALLDDLEEHELIPIPFLSPKQIYEISRSKEFIDWRVDYGSVWRTPEDGLYVLSVLLKQNPFLVTKILKESEEKK